MKQTCLIYNTCLHFRSPGLHMYCQWQDLCRVRHLFHCHSAATITISSPLHSHYPLDAFLAWTEIHASYCRDLSNLRTPHHLPQVDLTFQNLPAFNFSVQPPPCHRQYLQTHLVSGFPTPLHPCPININNYISKSKAKSPFSVGLFYRPPL